MSSANILTLIILWGTNAAVIAFIIRLNMLANRTGNDPELEITDYVYSDGRWVKL